MMFTTITLTYLSIILSLLTTISTAIGIHGENSGNFK